MKSYYIIVYGCQMNLSDSERIRAVLDKVEFKEVKKQDEADLIIIVACSIRQKAIDRIYGKIPSLKKKKINNPKLKTIVTGCILEKDKKIFTKNFDFVINIKEIAKIPYLLKLNKKNSFITSDYLKIKPKQISEFSATIPIMTGCNNYCTFCVVPYVRGNKRCRPVIDILNEIEFLIKNNYKEIWLLGQNVNDYEAIHEREEYNFPKLLAKIDKLISLNQQEVWIRFTSPHPKNFSDELITIIANGKNITNYINIPMQSGDNNILKRMNRGYTIEEYNDIIRNVRLAIPNISLSTDLILGFSGENEKAFQNTIKAIQKNEFDMIYINSYSIRKGTTAEKFIDNITQKEKKRRWEIINKKLQKMSLGKNKNYLNKTIKVLIDSCDNKNYLGKTRDYKTVKIKKEKDQLLIGKFIKVKIIDVQAFGLKGEILNLKS